MALFAFGCASLPPCPAALPAVPPLAVEEIGLSLFLIGDAGEANPEGEPVLVSLGSALEQAAAALGSERVVLVFLGDNLYPAGLTDEGTRNRPALEARLRAQLALLEPIGPGAAIFVPGNHDWAENRRDGRERLANQEKFLAEAGGGRAELLPKVGCPGPEVIDSGERLRLIVLDTHWWLRSGPVPRGPGAGCAAGTEEEVLRQLEEALAGRADREVVVVAHHPLESGGPHGGHDFFRGLGLIPQDLPHRRYRAMKAGLEEVFGRQPPLVYAAGHDHGLQLLEGHGYPYQLVSGAGSSVNLTRVGALPGTLACRGDSGWARIDFARDQRVRLGLWVAPGGEIYSSWLDRAAPRP